MEKNFPGSILIRPTLTVTKSSSLSRFVRLLRLAGTGGGSFVSVAESKKQTF
jgi:hypothetical protein